MNICFGTFVWSTIWTNEIYFFLSLIFDFIWLRIFFWIWKNPHYLNMTGTNGKWQTVDNGFVFLAFVLFRHGINSLQWLSFDRIKNAQKLILKLKFSIRSNIVCIQCNCVWICPAAFFVLCSKKKQQQQQNALHRFIQAKEKYKQAVSLLNAMQKWRAIHYVLCHQRLNGRNIYIYI